MTKTDLLLNFSLEDYNFHRSLSYAQDASIIELGFNFLSNARAALHSTNDMESPCLHACLGSITWPRKFLQSIEPTALNLQTLAAAYGVVLTPITSMDDINANTILYIGTFDKIAHAYLTVPFPMPGALKQVILFDTNREHVVEKFDTIDEVSPSCKASLAFKVSTLLMTDSEQSPCNISLFDL
jgi:hypothetical protein